MPDEWDHLLDDALTGSHRNVSLDDPVPVEAILIVPGIEKPLRMPYRDAVLVAFNKFEMKYRPSKEDNSLGNPIPGGYDVKVGKKL